MDSGKLNALFQRASRLAESGDLDGAAAAYTACLAAADTGVLSPAPELHAQFVRSAAINLAQVLNKQKRFVQALDRIELAMSLSPTPAGRAIALAAQGEALCGIRKSEEGALCFERSAIAHPIIGALTAADSMTRVESGAFLAEAERLAHQVLNTYPTILTPNIRAEAYTIIGKVAVRRNHHGVAREWFGKALSEQPDCADANLQLKLLDEPVKGESQTVLAQCFDLARREGRLAEAADLLEKAMDRFPELRESNEYWARTWRKGIAG
jgi:tetratricopeptide (TPR) repeat protein